MTKNKSIATLFAEASDYRPGTLDNLPPRIIQPKLNGIRAMWIPEKFGFYSRDGVLYSPDVTEHMIPPKDLRHLYLDGEFYFHGWSLQRINSAVGVNREKPKQDSLQIRHHVFDFIDTRPQLERLRMLEQYAGLLATVPYHLMSIPDDMENWFVEYMSQGYEGIILRNTQMPYINGRTHNILKRKGWRDEDFPVVGVTDGKGKHEGSIGALVCAVGNNTFTVDGMTDEDRDAWAANPSMVIGRKAKVKFLLLSDDGIPLMPKLVGVVDGK
jgi:DNA ligase-1